MQPTDTSLAARIDALVDPHVGADGPGVVIGVARGGQMLYRRAAGRANVEHGVPATPATRMRIGSVSKQVACLAALLLAEDGVLDIDAPIGRYLPELPAPAAATTLLQLMHHTAGIRCHIDTALVADGLAVRPPGASAQALLRQGACNFAPGTHMAYSNGGYHLLSLAMERASGQALEDIFAQRVFAPLGMHATALVRGDLDVHPGLAGLYVGAGAGRWRRGIFPNQDMLGEGGLVSTVDDMLAWLGHLRRQDTVGTAATWTRMMGRARFPSGFTAEYALGFFVERHRGLEVWNHAGNVLGGASHVLTVPAHALDVVVMANGAAVDPIEVANAIVDIVLADALEADEPWARSADFAGLIGDYYAPDSGMVYSFEDLDGILGMSTCWDPANPLALRDCALELTFSRNSAGHFTVPLADVRARTITVRESGTPETAHRLPQSAPPFDTALAGAWTCADLDAVARIDVAGRMDVKGASGGNRLQLRMVAPDLMHVTSLAPGLPRGGVLRVLRGAGRVALELNLSRTRHLVFERSGDAP